MSALKALLTTPGRPGTNHTNTNDSEERPQPRLLSPISLLPSPSIRPANTNRTIPHALHMPRVPNTSHPLRPKPKVIKDAPVFIRSPTRGPLRYPPHVYPADQLATSSTSINSTSSPATNRPDSVNTKPRTRSSTTSSSTTTPSSSATSNPLLSDIHSSFSIFPPQSEIGLYPRHIPYNSEKQIFYQATARDFFEVYQYTFRVPDSGFIDNKGRGCGVGNDGKGTDEEEAASGTAGEEDDGAEGAPGGAAVVGMQGEGKTYTMLWDYNTGLVRTTPLFKCCGYGKTTPAKMLNRNVGLKEICHSITGGALVAQGYWIPHAAAKAIAATFCYSIRFALTPVFGLDFLDLCLPPDHPSFGVMMIDPSITAQCRAEAAAYRAYEIENPTARPTMGGGARRGGTRTPSPARSSPVRKGTPGRGLPLMNAPAGGVGMVGGGRGGVGAGSGVSSGGESSNVDESEIGEPDDDTYLLSPTATATVTQHYVSSPGSVVGSPVFRNVWTHTNVPRSQPMGFDEEGYSPKSVMKAFGGKDGKGKRMFKDYDDGEYGVLVGGQSAYSSPGQSPKRGKVGVGAGRGWTVKMMGEQEDTDGGYEADADEMDVDVVDENAGAGRRMGRNGEGFDEFDAATALLGLGMHIKREPGRRASA